MTPLALGGLDGRYVGIGASGAALIILLALAVCLVAYYFLRKRVPRKTILALLLLFLVGYGVRLFIILRSPLVYGIDGPYYVMQVESIVETGAPSEKEVEPLVLYLASGASVLVNDATLGIKLTQVFFSTLPILTMWLLAFYLTKNNFASFVATLLMAFSAMSVGISDALRNAGALAFLPLFYLFFFKFVNGEGREWTIKTLKIHGKKFGLTLNLNLVFSFLIFLVILGCHFLTAGFAVMTVVAYVAFFTGYRRKIPWPELKFVATLGILVLIAMAVSGTIRNKIINTSNGIATSEPVPADLFPFSEAPMQTPAGGAGGAPPASILSIFLPFILIALPAMWFTLRHSDQRYLLFTATIPLALLCDQNWIVNYMYTFRLMLMMYVALFVLVGISVWYLRKRFKKVAAAVLVAGVGFSFITIIGMGAMTGPWITVDQWTELRSIGQQLPENSIVTTSEEGLFYWGSLVFKQMGSTFIPGWGFRLDSLAQEMRSAQTSGMAVLAVVRNNLVEGENLESLGLKLYDNVQTEHYCVLELVENSGGTQQRNADQENGPGGLPVYLGATSLGLGQAEIENMFEGWGLPAEASVAAYSTTASVSEVADWYKAQMSGWVLWYENVTEHSGFLSYGNESTGREAQFNVFENTVDTTVLVLVEGPMRAEGGQGEHGGGPEEGEPTATSDIRFNHNPLFAFILLPIELVQGLYGTAVYGVTKLVIAIPLSVGLIGLLIGLVPLIVRRFKKSKPPRKRK